MQAGAESGSRVKVTGPLSIPGLTGRPFSDERSLLLGESPAYIASQASSDGQAHYAAVPGQALGRRALMDLLYTLAPYKAHGPDRFARVLDNWGLLDRAKTSSTSESLLLQHVRSLKSSWHEFARHRDLYIEVFEDLSETRRVLPVIAWTKGRDGRRRWQFDTRNPALADALAEVAPALTTRAGEQRPTLDALLGLVAIPYFMPALHRNWPAWRPLVKDGKSNYIGPASVPVIALMHRRAILNSAFIENAERYVEAAD